MKNRICILIVISFLATIVNAQQRGPDKRDEGKNWDKYKTEKISYITQALELTPAEAQVFWPIYNQFEKEKMETMMVFRSFDKDMNEKIAKMSDDELKALTRKLADAQVKEGEISRKYNEEFLKILSPKKVVQLYQTESRFKHHLISKIREGSGQPGTEKRTNN